MAAPIVKLYSTTAARLKDLNVVDGQLIFVKDIRKIYLDLNGIRVDYSLIQVLESDEERLSILAPVEGFYYVEGTGVLWRYKNKWVQISPDNLSPIFFGSLEDFPENGNATTLYVDDDTIYRWDALTLSYLAVANKTEWKNLD